MPKIRQALAVLAAAASCIAFNTYRYPVVREMVVAISSPAQAEAAKAVEKPSAIAAERTLAAPATAESSKPRDRLVCKDGVCSLPLSDSPTASLNGKSQTQSFGEDPIQDGTAGGSSRGSTSGNGDRWASTPPDAKTAGKSKKSAKEPSQKAKASPRSKSSGSFLNEKGSDSASTGSEESVDAFNRAESEPFAPRDARNPDLRPSDATTALVAKGAATAADPYVAPGYGAGDEKISSEWGSPKALAGEPGERKPRDRSPSPAKGNSAASSENDTRPPKAASLVPIVRPASRTQRSETAAAKAMAGFQLTGQRGTKSEGVRHLPPVDAAFPPEPPSVSPDLARTYPVTSAE